MGANIAKSSFGKKNLCAESCSHFTISLYYTMFAPRVPLCVILSEAHRRGRKDRNKDYVVCAAEVLEVSNANGQNREAGSTKDYG